MLNDNRCIGPPIKTNSSQHNRLTATSYRYRDRTERLSLSGSVREYMPILRLVLVTVLTTHCGAPVSNPTLLDDILEARASKDLAFLEGKSSPVPPSLRENFLPLSYFEPDHEYIVPAVLRPPEMVQAPIEMPTSTGKIRPMQLAGVLEFALKGMPFQLTCFLEVGSKEGERLFVPFTDLTTGAETYVAGRYIDLDWKVTGLYELNFNMAYHPYCYYDERFDCPYPPYENRLNVAIRAGEKLPVGESILP